MVGALYYRQRDFAAAYYLKRLKKKERQNMENGIKEKASMQNNQKK